MQFEINENDAKRMQAILEFANQKQAFYIDELCESFTNISESEIEHYLMILSQQRPEVLHAQGDSGIYVGTGYLKEYLEKGGFIANYSKMAERQKEDQSFRDLQREQMQAAINDSKIALRRSRNANWIAIVAVVVAIIALFLRK